MCSFCLSPLHVFIFFPRENICFLFLIKASTQSLMMIRMCGRDLDSEYMDAQMGSNLIAHADAVSEQIKEGKDQGNPKYNILINKAVKVLVQEQKCRAYECCIMQVHFTFGHMCNHQFVSYLS